MQLTSNENVSVNELSPTESCSIVIAESMFQEIVPVDPSASSNRVRAWAVMIDVYSEHGKPDTQALAQCDRLRRAYDLPVLMQFSSGRMTMDMGELDETD